VIDALTGIRVMAFRSLKKFVYQRPQVVIVFAGLLTAVWLVLLFWVSAGLFGLI
jgi:hypothetical protein